MAASETAKPTTEEALSGADQRFEATGPSQREIQYLLRDTTMPYRCLTSVQASVVGAIAAAATNSPYGPAILLYIADQYLAHKAAGEAGDFRVSRTQILEHLNHEISRAALRKLLLSFEEKNFVKLDGRYVGATKSLTGRLTPSVPDTLKQLLMQEPNTNVNTCEVDNTTSESQMPCHKTNDRPCKDSIRGPSGQNAAWDTEEHFALNCAIETIATYMGERKELVLFKLAGACAAPPSTFLAAVCGVASALRSSLPVEDYVVEVRTICANKSSLQAANPRTLARVQQAYIAVLTDGIKREQDKRKAAEHAALGSWFLSELGKRMEAQAQPAAATSVNSVRPDSPITESGFASAQPGKDPVDGATAKAAENTDATKTPSLMPPSGAGLLGELLKLMHADTLAPANQVADPKSVDAAVPTAPDAKAGTPSTADPDCIAPSEAVPPTPPEDAQNHGEATDARDKVKLAKIYQLYPSSDWFKAA